MVINMKDCTDKSAREAWVLWRWLKHVNWFTLGLMKVHELLETFENVMY